jgi:hypothetical protein
MKKATTVFWDELTEELKDPQFAALFYLETERIQMIDSIINQLDDLRIEANVSKVELARRMQSEPANVRRLFSAMKSNPTAATIVDIALALGYQLKLEPLPKSRQRKIAKALENLTASDS